MPKLRCDRDTESGLKMGGAINAFMPKSELLYHSQHCYRGSLQRHRSENCNSVTKIFPRRVGDRIGFLPISELLYRSQHFHRASLERHRSENCNSVTKISPRRVGDRVLAPLLFKRDSAIGSKTAFEASHSPLRPSPPAQCRTIAVAIALR